MPRKRGIREWELPERVSKRSRGTSSPEEKKPLEILVHIDDRRDATLGDWREHLLRSTRVPTLRQECKRSQAIDTVRAHYVTLCQERLHWRDAPKSSFNRFLTDHLLDKPADSSDPLLPSLADIGSRDPSDWATHTRLFQEIEEDYPAKIKPPLQFVENWKQLKNHVSEFIKACKRVESNFPQSTPDDLSALNCQIAKADDLLQKLNRRGSFRERKRDYLAIRDGCTPIWQHILSPVSLQIVLGVMERSSQLIHTLEGQEASPAPRVIVSHTGGVSTFTCEELSVSVTAVTIQRLCTLFKAHGGDGDEDNAIFLLLARYHAFIGTEFGAGGLHAALPRKVFHCLKRDFDVAMECFASPLNAYFDSFCSAFGDTDRAFGSVGSFFHFRPTRGSFEANPPFCEHLMLRMVEHMEDLLSGTEEPLSFTVIIPDWSDADAHRRLSRSRWFRASTRVYGKEHYYKSGLQHQSQNGQLYYQAVHDTIIFFLQNSRGHDLWYPSDRKLETLRDAFWSTNDSY